VDKERDGQDWRWKKEKRVCGMKLCSGWRIGREKGWGR
jgi:hypothetical protein